MTSPNSILQIDLPAIRHNMPALSRFVGPGTGICPVHKPNDHVLGADRFRLAGVYTHVSSTCDDLRSLHDHARTFDTVLHRLRAFLPPGALVHVANTVATLAAKSLHRDMVRVGLAWAGYGDDEFPET